MNIAARITAVASVALLAGCAYATVGAGMPSSPITTPAPTVTPSAPATHPRAVPAEVNASSAPSNSGGVSSPSSAPAVVPSTVAPVTAPSPTATPVSPTVTATPSVPSPSQSVSTPKTKKPTPAKTKVAPKPTPAPAKETPKPTPTKTTAVPKPVAQPAESVQARCDRLWAKAKSYVASSATTTCASVPNGQGRAGWSGQSFNDGTFVASTTFATIDPRVMAKHDDQTIVGLMVHELAHTRFYLADRDAQTAHAKVMGSTPAAYSTGTYTSRPAERFAQGMAVCSGAASSWHGYAKTSCSTINQAFGVLK